MIQIQDSKLMTDPISVNQIRNPNLLIYMLENLGSRSESQNYGLDPRSDISDPDTRSEETRFKFEIWKLWYKSETWYFMIQIRFSNLLIQLQDVKASAPDPKVKIYDPDSKFISDTSGPTQFKIMNRIQDLKYEIYSSMRLRSSNSVSSEPGSTISNFDSGSQNQVLKHVCRKPNSVSYLDIVYWISRVASGFREAFIYFYCTYQYLPTSYFNLSSISNWCHIKKKE